LRGEHLELLEGQASLERWPTGERAWQLAMLVINSAGGCYGLVRPSSRLVTASIG